MQAADHAPHRPWVASGQYGPQDVLTTSWSVTSNVATAGSLAARPGAKSTFEPLAAEFQRAEHVDRRALSMRFRHAALRDGFKPTGTRLRPAERLIGPVVERIPTGRAAELNGGPARPIAPTWRSRVRRRTS